MRLTGSLPLLRSDFPAKYFPGCKSIENSPEGRITNDFLNSCSSDSIAISFSPFSVFGSGEVSSLTSPLF